MRLYFSLLLLYLHELAMDVKHVVNAKVFGKAVSGEFVV